ncbi:DUF1593 domain-containing protein [Aurantibacter crassamenti]|uniref:DUF1593 domain-containing protein n=1 Tax=Aurantibacter crassamenti TaxID=1837375 RepID=UPI00193A8C6B|nr:DUF1593 domain-containing protein [Aurantibacter crassamenti]MBM1105853.1 DUF1593 domain-containing protein [Aurantibacter crassamenti]
MKKIAPIFFALVLFTIQFKVHAQNQKPRIIVTSDGEIDDECSMVRFLLYSNEWDVEGIVTSSSQYHWHGHKWAGDDWIDRFLDAYEEIHPNLIKHDKAYPTAAYLRSINFLGNVETEGEMEKITPGSEHIVKVLLDESDNNPIWLQAWGGTNTIARALKSIEENHPEKMEEVAKKLRFFFIWEQDETYQTYIKPHWGKYNIETIICDQFWAVAYQWDKIIPADKLPYFKSDWIKSNILENHGPLCSLYEAYKGGDDNEGFLAEEGKAKGDFRSEGDSPAFFYTIPTGLRSLESPDYGGWGGRYLNVRENTWLDSVPESNYNYPEGRWYTKTAWGRNYMRNVYPENKNLMTKYFTPITRWTDALQNDFAARADWSVKSFDEANHPPIVKSSNKLDIDSKPGSTIKLDTKGTVDPDGDDLTFSWWQYHEVDSYPRKVNLLNAANKKVEFVVPKDAKKGETIHIICEVTDNGSPKLTRYQRIIITIK